MNYTTPDIKQDSDKTEVTYFSPLIMIIFSFIICLNILWPNSMNQFYAMITQPLYLSMLFSLSCFVFVLMMLVEIVTLALDKKYKWEEDFLKRLTFQLVYGGLAATIVLLVPIYCIYLYILEIDLGRYLQLGHILFMVIMVNMIYGFYYYVELVHLGLKTLKEGKPDNQYRNYFTVPEGIGKIKIDLTEIAYFYRDERDVYLKSFNGKKYPLWQSLDDIQKELDSEQFFRLNRKHIVNRNAILNATKSIRKGMDVHIIRIPISGNSTDNEIISLDLSREKTPEFKSWLKMIQALE